MTRKTNQETYAISMKTRGQRDPVIRNNKTEEVGYVRLPSPLRTGTLLRIGNRRERVGHHVRNRRLMGELPLHLSNCHRPLIPNLNCGPSPRLRPLRVLGVARSRSLERVAARWYPRACNRLFGQHHNVLCWIMLCSHATCTVHHQYIHASRTVAP